MLGPLYILPRIGIHDDLLALIDEDRHTDGKTLLNFRLFGDIPAGRIAFGRRLGFDDLECHFFRERHGDGLAFIKGQNHIHAVLQILRGVSQLIFAHGMLLIRFGIHKMKSAVIMVQILHGFMLHIHKGNAFGNFVRLFQCIAGADVLDAASNERRAFARVDMLEFRHHPRIIIVEENDAFFYFIRTCHIRA